MKADQSPMLYLKKCAKSLGKHCVGICNYAKHKLTSARIEAGNVSIGMIRKRARGIRDTGYFKLKIRQSSLPDNQSMFYLKTWNHSTKRRRAQICSFGPVRPAQNAIQFSRNPDCVGPSLIRGFIPIRPN